MEQPASLEALPFEFVVNMVDGEPHVEFHAYTSTPCTSIELYIFEPGSKSLTCSATLIEGQTTAKLSGLMADIPYDFGVRYVKGEQIASIRGQLSINVKIGDNGDKVAEVDTLIDFQEDGVPGDISPLATVYETESNNTSGTANPVSTGDIVRGAINPVGDRDWFRVVFPASGVLNLSLSNIPSGCDYELCLYDSSVNPIATSLTPGSVDEHISYNVTAGRIYYIQVYAYQGTSSSLYTLRINGPTQAHTWYSQVTSEGGSFNWDRSKLNNLYFPNMQSCRYCESQMKCSHTPFWTSSSYSPAPNQLEVGHMNKWGCFVTSYAMVLRNLNATTTVQRTDFRTNTTGRLQADPFIVTMVNLNWPQIMNQNGRYEISSYAAADSPVTIQSHSSIANAFGKTYISHDFASLTTPEARASELTRLIEENPAGVIVRFDGHSMVFAHSSYQGNRQATAWEPLTVGTVVTPENERQVLGPDFYTVHDEKECPVEITGTDYDAHFTVYDPAASTSAKGEGVPLPSAYSYTKYGGIDNIKYVIVLR